MNNAAIFYQLASGMVCRIVNSDRHAFSFLASMVGPGEGVVLVSEANYPQIGLILQGLGLTPT